MITSRFVIAGRSGLKRSSNTLMNNFLKIKISSFGAKSKDTDVDKSKKSVSGGGATASDSDKREPSQQTIKVAKSGKAPETTKPQTEQKTAEAPSSSNGVKIIKNIPGNRVSFNLNFSLPQLKILFQEDTLILCLQLLLRKVIYTMSMKI